MENMQTVKPEARAAEDINKSFTPHQLVQRHMANPDEPITDAAMENLDLSLDSMPANNEVRLTPSEKQNADELADAIKSNSTGMSYKADI